jgi:hypothetical protein
VSAEELIELLWPEEDRHRRSPELVAPAVHRSRAERTGWGQHGYRAHPQRERSYSWNREPPMTSIPKTSSFCTANRSRAARQNVWKPCCRHRPV